MTRTSVMLIASRMPTWKKLGLEKGDLVAFVETEQGVLITPQEVVATAALDKIGALGEEKERHIFTEPTAVICPAELLHCPLTITKVDKPFILSDVRPFGSGYETAGQMGVTSQT